MTDLQKYKEYAEWLQSLPEADEHGVHYENGGRWQQPKFVIAGQEGSFVLGPPENEGAVVALLPQGKHLKDRVFVPLRRPDD